MATLYRILIRLAIAWLVIIGGSALAIGAFGDIAASREARNPLANGRRSAEQDARDSGTNLSMRSL
jgi:hypothetical protein